MPSSGIDPQEIAAAALAEAMVPMPEDFLPALDPLANLWYLWNAADQVVTVWTAFLTGDQAESLGDGGEVAQAFGAIMSAMGMITEACVQVSILPPEAAGQ